MNMHNPLLKKNSIMSNKITKYYNALIKITLNDSDDDDVESIADNVFDSIEEHLDEELFCSDGSVSVDLVKFTEVQN